MSIFPTKILVATDGSREAQLAATTAAELANSTNSELHVVHVGELRPTFLAQTEVEPAELQREAQRLLDEQLRRVEQAGGTVKEAHLRQGAADEEIVELAGEESGTVQAMFEDVVSTVFEGRRFWSSLAAGMVLMLGAGHVRVWLGATERT